MAEPNEEATRDTDVAGVAVAERAISDADPWLSFAESAPARWDIDVASFEGYSKPFVEFSGRCMDVEVHTIRNFRRD